MNNWAFVAVLFLLLSASEAKKFERCELAKELKKAGMDKLTGVTLADWVCLAFYESKFRSRIVSGVNQEGSRNYGIFQISSKWWCTTGQKKPDKGCFTYCKAFSDDDITDDIECVKQIVHYPIGMSAWSAWKRFCKGRNLSRWTRNCEL